MEKMDCEFCKKVFKTKYSLTTHKQSTKSCLLIQGNVENETIFEYKCSFCEKKFSLNQHLERHEKICKVKKQEEQESISKQLEDYKKLRAEIKQQRQYEKEIKTLKDEVSSLKEELYKKDLKIEILKTEIRVKDELKEDVEKIIEKNNNDKLIMFKDVEKIIEKNNNDKLTMFKDVVNKSNKTTNNTNNTVNNIYIQQQLDQLTPINELADLIATNPLLSSTLKSLSSLDDFYYLCADTSKKCFLVKDSSREIVSGRKLDENNKVEYVTGKMQSLIGDCIVSENLCKKAINEYKGFIDRITENPEEELDCDESVTGVKLLSLCDKLSKAKKNNNKLSDEEALNVISKKAMTLIPKIKNKQLSGPELVPTE